eukprot:CAMPEP_0113856890 /NCGR_PEP_ID=MMETSP0372-20130328/9640_1 /TAXON_ID=340204 /ORGANISM="Lankesteria abbotti" /LENGTH=136 /DNA_ID=CAMNT_0000832247 /DNA_START=97 /DNA_END=503 /DNA_ORIENTATION=+ /assembly_acc=CAM_ASM_000359
MKAAGMEYEDKVMTVEEWAAAKFDPKTAPYGGVPTLLLPNGELLCETFALATYIGMIGDLMYSDALLQARVTEVVMAVDEFFGYWKATVVMTDPTKKQEVRAALFQTTFRKLAENLDASLSRTSKSYAVGDKFTLA